ncbi:MAG: FAD-binding and (Fe-S)-binding domain-containing protein [Bacteroidales bacterium]
MHDLAALLTRVLGPDRVKTDDLTLIATSADAGCYRKIPKIVLNPQNEEEVVRALGLLHRHRTPVTFRAAGTSLSGQAISDSVLMQARGDHWKQCEVLEQGRLIRTGPGITGARLNQILAPFGRKFGPDPASINSAMIGGIIANNASGMSCGIHANSYATIASARLILSDGTVLDTADPASRSVFREKKPELINTIQGLQFRLRSDPELVARIHEKYSIKNTTGYSLNALIDYDDPIEAILHLMVGSEGTLGFVSEATFRTVPVKPHRASALIYFRDLYSACEAIPRLRDASVPAIEIMDREALRSVEEQPGIPAYIRAFGDGVTALLIDLEAESAETLDHLISATEKAVSGFSLVRDFEVTADARQIAAYWHVRKGVFPSVGGMRKPGTSVIIEDIAVRAGYLTEAVLEMRHMLDELGYPEAVIYGHVLDGNLHFIFSQDFQDPEEVEKYSGMIERLTRMVVERFSGSLKAEHGTGRNMAPFVAYEWGEKLYKVMKKIKAAFDPEGILNPDVIITGDPELHLKDFKPMPAVDESVDRCIECGFCEVGCLTTGYTLSARQRIVVQRELVQLQPKEGKNGQKARPGERARNLVRDYRYQGEGSCAADGLCAVSCPLSIDTGILIKKIRARENEKKRPAMPLARWASRHMETIHSAVELGLGTMFLLGRILPLKKVLFWDRHLPRPVRSGKIVPSLSTLPEPAGAGPGKELKVVYFPSCISQSMGTSVRDPGKKSLPEVTVEVLKQAGYQVIFPEGMRSLCCGTPWESKGFHTVADAMSSRLEDALLKASEGGKIPILCDTSPCIYRMKRVLSKKLTLCEPVEFVHDHLLGRLKLNRSQQQIAFHITCSSRKMGLEEKFKRVARACTHHPLFPEEVGCCGFAGDKGFTDPALNRWALRNLKPALNGTAEGYSNSRTCEIGLSRNSGIDYRSVMYLVHQAMQQPL